MRDNDLQGVMAVNQARHEEIMQISKTRWRLEKDMSFFVKDMRGCNG